MSSRVFAMGLETNMTIPEQIVQRIELKSGVSLRGVRLDDAVFTVFCAMNEKDESITDLDFITQAVALYQQRNGK